MARFQATKEDGGLLSLEKQSGQGVYSFLDHLASGVYPVPRFDRVGVLQVDPNVTVHVMHSLFSVLVNL